jgi:hypothetical protein
MTSTTSTYYAKPENDVEALTLGLFLSLTAPTDELSVECAEMAELIAESMHPDTVEACKTVALERAEVIWEMQGE